MFDTTYIGRITSLMKSKQKLIQMRAFSYDINESLL